MDKSYRVNEIALILGFSSTTIYKHLSSDKKRVKPHCYKEKGILFFNETALEIFRETISTADKSAVPAIQFPPASVQDNRLEGIEKALLTMAEKMNSLVESNKIILEENRALRVEVSTLQKALVFNKPEPVREEPKKESLLPSVSQDLRVDPRRVVSSQRQLSLWESIQVTFNDVSRFLFFRG